MSDSLTVYSAWTREPVHELPYNTAADAEAYLKESVQLWKQGICQDWLLAAAPSDLTHKTKAGEPGGAQLMHTSFNTHARAATVSQQLSTSFPTSQTITFFVKRKGGAGPRSLHFLPWR